jgi:hypothetical protein
MTGAPGRTRTSTMLPLPDFELVATTFANVLCGHAWPPGVAKWRGKSLKSIDTP